MSGRRTAGRRRRSRPLLILVVVVVVVLLLAAAGAIVASQEQAPLLTSQRTLPTSVTFPGAAPALDFSAQGESAVEVEGLGQLGHAGPTYPLPIASMAKVMTAYVVLSDHPLADNGTGGFTVTISAADVAAQAADEAQGQSTLPVAAGETLTEQQALEGLLLPSGNNIADLLAGTDAGSEAAFVAQMNAKAKTLGMTSTTYTDPSGFDPTTVSTATDQLHLASAAMTIPAFREIVGLGQATLPVAGVVKNYNSLVGTDGFIGIKTGSDGRAGGCLMFADQRNVDGRSVEIIGTVLGQDAGTVATSVILGAVLTASRNLADSVTSSLSVKPVVAAGTSVLTVRNADGRQVRATTTKPLSELGYGGEHIPLSVTATPLGRRLSVDQQVATVHLGSSSATTTPVVARATMPGISWSWRLRHTV